MSSCCLCGLEYQRRSEGVGFHRMPKNTERRNRWLTTIEKKIHNFSYTNRSLICTEHFEKECFVITHSGKFYLKADAVPTIFNLPLKAKYNINEDQEILQQDRCDTSTSIEELSMPGSTEELSMHASSEELSIPASTEELPMPAFTKELPMIQQNQSKTGAYISILKTSHTTQFSNIQSVTAQKINSDGNSKFQHIKEENIKLKQKVKVLQQKSRRLQKRIVSLSLLTKHLQERNLRLENIVELLKKQKGKQ